MPSMNFIDISSHQQGMNLDAVFSQNELDGVMVKSTEGTKYVNPCCDPWVQWLIKNDKPWGFYHYLNHDNAVKEAQFFVEHCKNYFGHGMPAADYEGSIVNNYGSIYLLKFLKEVYSLTGVKPFVYCNLGVIQSDTTGFKEIVDNGFPLWLAQYYYTKETTLGKNILQVGSYYPFPKITMHQYSEKGIIGGYSGKVDLDIFYGDRADWEVLLSSAVEEKPIPENPGGEVSEYEWIMDGIEYWESVKRDIQFKIDKLKDRLK